LVEESFRDRLLELSEALIYAMTSLFAILASSSATAPSTRLP